LRSAVCHFVSKYYKVPLKVCHLAVLDEFVVLLVALRPAEAAVAPGRDNGLQPKYSNTIFLAKISPKPSMTPLTNGRSKLIAKDEKSAVSRVRVEREESNITRLADSSGRGGGGR